MRIRSLAIPAALVVSFVACAGEEPPLAPPPLPPPPPPPVVVAKPVYKGMDRAEFNRNAVRANLPVYWVNDADKDGVVEPSEVASLLFYPTVGRWVSGGGFTPEFDAAWQAIKAAGALSASTPPSAEDRRHALVAQDLDQGLPTIVANDFTQSSAEDKAFVGHMLTVARLIDDLFATQNGTATLAAKVPAGDALSASLFRRNRGPRCVAPLTEKNPECTAIPGNPQPIVDAYPADMQRDPGFCALVEKLPGAKALLDPFVVMRGAPPGPLTAVPLSQAYADAMGAVSRELSAAADGVVDPNEGPLKTYLSAAARSFTNNDWTPADEAWSRMTVKNSKWYVRVAPDEVYWEPCSHKAGFHLTFARINKDSVAWQAKLDPVEQEMEQNLATRIGKSYKARKVAFHLPDFIDIVVNAGDDRTALGGTIGQSLPNYGPVANEGRGRTVAMSNLFNDADSVAIRRKQAESLLVADTIKSYSDSPDPELVGTILHEATHNLGPAHEYKFAGKTDEEAFGGGIASMLEELKAQTGALYFIDFAVKKGLVTPEFARQVYASSIVWAFGHISRGMYTETRAPKAYSQLAAIQVGFFLDEKAMTFDPSAKAADGSVGALAIDWDRFPKAVEKLMQRVGQIKATNDKRGASQLVAKYVDGPRVPQKLITDRELAYPKQSLVYAVGL
jgi:hypothetical protein